MPLRLTLKARERVIIGGAVLRNGNGRAVMLIENKVPVLRASDILSPPAAKTPCDQVYLALQLAYVEPENRAGHLEIYRGLASAVRDTAPSCSPFIDAIDDHIASGHYYQALKSASTLRRHEQELISHVQ
jgi:flagellar protein FlbT